MKSGGYLALVNPCSGGHIGPPQSSSSDLESSAKDHFGPIDVDADADSDPLSDESGGGVDDVDRDKKSSSSSDLKRSQSLHERIKSKIDSIAGGQWLQCDQIGRFIGLWATF